jgi:hypothetical protein
MEPLQFCYWLQGFAEVGSLPPNSQQWEIIKDHLQLVFDKKTPEYKSAGSATCVTARPYIDGIGATINPTSIVTC